MSAHAEPLEMAAKAMALTMTDNIVERIGRFDWSQLREALNGQGNAVLKGLLSPEEARALSSLYPADTNFRSRVVMARHGFGRGEYKYFGYPLPHLIETLRTGLYTQLAPIANEWNTAMKIPVQYPATHAEFIQRCHDAWPDKANAPIARIWHRGFQLSAPGPLWRACVPDPNSIPAVRTR